jgi:DNA-directed RNA polymerase subunit M/transcription elongation factor TFIIS
MSASNKTKAFAALNKFANARVQLIAALHEAGYSLETARDIVIEWACDKCDAAFNVSKSGKVMLDSKHENYEKAKTTVRDVMHMVQGTTRREVHAKTEPVDAVAKLAKQANALSAADKRRLLKLINA